MYDKHIITVTYDVRYRDNNNASMMSRSVQV